jgi:hypothetical protein
MRAPHDVVAKATKHGGFGALYYLGPSAEFALIGPLGFSVSVPRGWSALEVERRRLGAQEPTFPR